jgi:pimeloyl-ACP methyl ester carboxylesterase
MEYAMPGYVDIDGHPTWVDDQDGSGAPLLLLHGGMSNSDELLRSIGTGLAKRFRVVAFDRRGHGYTADTDADFHYADMATETVRVLEQVVGGPAHLVGWSDGGIVALIVALSRPDLVNRVVVIGTNYHYDGVMPVEMDPGTSLLQELSKAYIERSPDGAEHLESVFNKSFGMYSTEPTLTTADIAQIARPVLVVVGDDDLVALPHTVSLYEALPAGQLAVVPRASHALPLEQPEVVTGLIIDFLAAAEPPHTVIPIRRARPATV